MAAIKYFLVINPSAKSGRAIKFCKKILSSFEKEKAEFDYKMTQGPDEASFITQDAIEKNYDVIVAVGGDGTICEVISGFFHNGINRKNTKLGVLHVGTSPDFNRRHNIPIDLNKAIDALFKCKTLIVDIGKITYFSSSGKETTAYFGSSVNIGIGPYIAGRANSRYRKYLGDFLGTLCSSLRSLMHFDGVNLKVKIDGQYTDYNSLINLTVGKDPYLASGMRVFNEVKADDGRLFVFSIDNTSKLSLLANLHRLYVGNILKFKAASMKYAKEVEIECNAGDTFLEFDGDIRGNVPAKIGVLPKALEVIVG